VDAAAEQLCDLLTRQAADGTNHLAALTDQDLFLTRLFDVNRRVDLDTDSLAATLAVIRDPLLPLIDRHSDGVRDLFLRRQKHLFPNQLAYQEALGPIGDDIFGKQRAARR